ncbi:hypothetical protein F4779DRAFT_615611 [Xylariaceae sp. FL0662B]|nr:hypothetical protein F4779DRAFT_615611 [Xylariaceae sp. FL0662B]
MAHQFPMEPKYPDFTTEQAIEAAGLPPPPSTYGWNHFYEGEPPVTFFTDPISRGTQAIFSTGNGMRPFRAVDKPIYERPGKYWHATKIQDVCNGIRKEYYSQCKYIQPPRNYWNLYTYFDAHDIYHQGAQNLWRVIQHLFYENQYIMPELLNQMTTTFEGWAGRVLSTEAGREKLYNWKPQSQPNILDVFNNNELPEMYNVESFYLPTLRTIFTRHHMSLRNGLPLIFHPPNPTQPTPEAIASGTVICDGTSATAARVAAAHPPILPAVATPQPSSPGESPPVAEPVLPPAELPPSTEKNEAQVAAASLLNVGYAPSRISSSPGKITTQESAQLDAQHYEARYTSAPTFGADPAENAPGGITENEEAHAYPGNEHIVGAILTGPDPDPASVPARQVSSSSNAVPTATIESRSGSTIPTGGEAPSVISKSNSRPWDESTPSIETSIPTDPGPDRIQSLDTRAPANMNSRPLSRSQPIVHSSQIPALDHPDQRPIIEQPFAHQLPPSLLSQTRGPMPPRGSQSSGRIPPFRSSGQHGPTHPHLGHVPPRQQGFDRGHRASFSKFGEMQEHNRMNSQMGPGGWQSAGHDPIHGPTAVFRKPSQQPMENMQTPHRHAGEWSGLPMRRPSFTNNTGSGRMNYDHQLQNSDSRRRHQDVSHIQPSAFHQQAQSPAYSQPAASSGFKPSSAFCVNVDKPFTFTPEAYFTKYEPCGCYPCDGKDRTIFVTGYDDSKGSKEEIQLRLWNFFRRFGNIDNICYAKGLFFRFDHTPSVFAAVNEVNQKVIPEISPRPLRVDFRVGSQYYEPKTRPIHSASRPGEQNWSAQAESQYGHGGSGSMSQVPSQDVVLTPPDFIPNPSPDGPPIPTGPMALRKSSQHRKQPSGFDGQHDSSPKEMHAESSRGTIIDNMPTTPKSFIASQAGLDKSAPFKHDTVQDPPHLGSELPVNRNPVGFIRSRPSPEGSPTPRRGTLQVPMLDVDPTDRSCSSTSDGRDYHTPPEHPMLETSVGDSLNALVDYSSEATIAGMSEEDNEDGEEVNYGTMVVRPKRAQYTRLPSEWEPESSNSSPPIVRDFAFDQQGEAVSLGSPRPSGVMFAQRWTSNPLPSLSIEQPTEEAKDKGEDNGASQTNMGENIPELLPALSYQPDKDESNPELLPALAYQPDVLGSSSQTGQHSSLDVNPELLPALTYQPNAPNSPLQSERHSSLDVNLSRSPTPNRDHKEDSSTKPVSLTIYQSPTPYRSPTKHSLLTPPPKRKLDFVALTPEGTSESKKPVQTWTEGEPRQHKEPTEHPAPENQELYGQHAQQKLTGHHLIIVKQRKGRRPVQSPSRAAPQPLEHEDMKPRTVSTFKPDINSPPLPMYPYPAQSESDKFDSADDCEPFPEYRDPITESPRRKQMDLGSVMPGNDGWTFIPSPSKRKNIAGDDGSSSGSNGKKLNPRAKVFESRSTSPSKASETMFMPYDMSYFQPQNTGLGYEPADEGYGDMPKKTPKDKKYSPKGGNRKDQSMAPGYNDTYASRLKGTHLPADTAGEFRTESPSGPMRGETSAAGAARTTDDNHDSAGWGKDVDVRPLSNPNRHNKFGKKKTNKDQKYPGKDYKGKGKAVATDNSHAGSRPSSSSSAQSKGPVPIPIPKHKNKYWNRNKSAQAPAAVPVPVTAAIALELESAVLEESDIGVELQEITGGAADRWSQHQHCRRQPLPPAAAAAATQHRCTEARYPHRCTALDHAGPDVCGLATDNAGAAGACTADTRRLAGRLAWRLARYMVQGWVFQGWMARWLPGWFSGWISGPDTSEQQ